MKKLIKNKKIAYLITIFCALLWGSAFPTIKTTFKELSILPGDMYSMIYIAGIRFFIAGLIVLLFMSFFDKKNIIQLKTKFSSILKISLLITTFGYFFFYIGTANTSGMKASIITSSNTFLVVLLSHFLLKNENFNIYKFFAIILGLTGTIVANFTKEFNFSFSIFGEGFLFINALVMSLGMIYVKKFDNISPFAKVSGQFLFGSIFLIIIGKIGMNANLIFTFKSILLIFYASIISSVAFVLWYLVLQEHSLSEITFIRLFTPFFGTMLSSIFLNEKLNPSIIIGLILVIIGIVIVNKSEEIKNFISKKV